MKSISALIEKKSCFQKVEIRWKLDNDDADGDDEASEDDHHNIKPSDQSNHSNQTPVTMVTDGEQAIEQQTQRMATGFVASILARSVADFITDECKSGGQDSQSPQVGSQSVRSSSCY